MLDLPRFAALRYNAELDLWEVTGTRMTYAEAVECQQRWAGKGVDNIYVVGLAFIRGPGDEEPENPRKGK